MLVNVEEILDPAVDIVLNLQLYHFVRELILTCTQVSSFRRVYPPEFFSFITPLPSASHANYSPTISAVMWHFTST